MLMKPRTALRLLLVALSAFPIAAYSQNSINRALHFSRPSNVVDIDGSTVAEQELTIEAIVAFDSIPNRPGFLYLEDWAEQGSAEEDAGEKHLGVSPAGIQGFAFPKNGDLGPYRKTRQLALNKWHHVAYVVDKKFERIYLNGRRIAQRRTTDADITESVTSCLLGFGWTGYISSFRISNVARYKGKTHKPVYTKLKNQKGTMLLYNFNGLGDSDTIEDESGNGRTGYLGRIGFRTPDATRPEYVYFGADLSIDTDRDGVTDFLELNEGTNPQNAKSFNGLSRGLVGLYHLERDIRDSTGFGRHASVAAGSETLGYGDGSNEDGAVLNGPLSMNVPVGYNNLRNFSLSLWARRSQDIFAHIVLMDGAHEGVGLGWGWREGAAKPGFYVRLAGIWTGPFFQEALDFGKNEWTHVAASVNSSGSVETYVNGQPIGSFQIPIPVPWETGVPSSVTLDLAGPDRLGRVDEVRVYDRVLKPSEVAAIHDSGNPDRDGDGIGDKYETNTGVFVSAADTGTNPDKADSNEDNISDGEALRLGFDPNKDYTLLFRYVQLNPANFNLHSRADYLKSERTGELKGIAHVLERPRKYDLIPKDEVPLVPQLRLEMPAGTPFRMILEGEAWTRYAINSPGWPVDGGTVSGIIAQKTARTVRFTGYKDEKDSFPLRVTLSPPDEP